jgi:FKBP-type peptidyl-prolyl cis-trans isomerase
MEVSRGNLMLMHYSILLILLMLVSCSSDVNTISDTEKPGKTEMEDLNRFMVQKDRERIISYAERKNLSVEEAPTGLWYYISEPGNGNALKEGDRVILDYECYLLDGTLCYSSLETGPMDIVLGSTGIEPGLYDGLRLLRPGARAVFIIPPYLAHGLPGDGRKIPPRSIIVYKVLVRGVNNNF